MVKSFTFPGVGKVFIESNQHPGILQIIPTDAAVMSSVSWNVYKRPPRKFDVNPFINENGAIVIDEHYSKAAEEFRVANLTGDPEIDDCSDGDLTIALKSSLEDYQVEHALDNTGFETASLVCLEFIGCESSSENLYPDHQYTSRKTAFTDAEIERIVFCMELLLSDGMLP